MPISSKKNFRNTEKIKWIFICINFILCVLIKYCLTKINFFIQTSLIIFLIICTICTLIYTEKGKSILLYIKASKSEMQKIMWPKYKETLYTTFIIIFVTIFMSLVLWGIDNVIFRLIAFFISLKL
ncbi:preprotein translocase subunit SecE [Buchnera aphidicola (Aphis gossypii)]|uniref:Protein translocase subunit SecE n=2 Tax=Buchnera aphidicola TaxID=9 RepID=A0A5J6Z9C3_9GAMM|nr:preprotein translocase subunit SecE [Buchnera aphidicola]QFQ31900.1 preprotein translocase subunit SecE [Buchnera aphidicola (Aphis gossypii)]UPT14432.1 preprotein translocase subunit SecE [Buchnera aphidicola (Aphis gossypii)]